MAIHFHQHQLANNLTVIAETNDAAYTGAVGFFVKVGARDETKDIMGVSHFLEHMMFKGTDRRSAEDVNREFDELGANYNAFTSQECTAYWAHVLPECLPRAVDLFADMLRPALREDDFAMEKNVILEEIGMYEDRPQSRLQNSLNEAYFAGHPLSFRVLGTTESIQAMGAKQMRGYFGQRYGPDNITVAAAGRIDFDKLVKDVERSAGDWQPTGAKRQYDPATVQFGDEMTVDQTLNRHYLAMLCPGPSAQDMRRYAAGILVDVLGDTEGSRLYWALVDPGLCDEADLSHYPQDQVGSFCAYASCDPDRARQVEQILIQTLDTYADSIDAKEIERAKNKLATDATLAGESPAGRMRGLGGQWTYLGEYIPLAEEIDRIMAVTMHDIRDLIDAMPFQPRTIVRLGPKAL